MKEKYLSIITNFGCHGKCPYCIVKNNNIDVPQTTIDGLFELEKAVKSENANIISVSGGGDPLHEYHKHTFYYDYLFNRCKWMNIPLEMHTSYINSGFPYGDCYRVVYHLNSIEQLKQIRKHGNEIVRVVFVVTEDFTEDLILKIVKYINKTDQIDELSFRQMVDKNYEVKYYLHDFLKEYHKINWWYIEQNDYNTYFVNGKIYYKFSDISANLE